MFATHLLNQFYIKDTAARIAVFRDDLNYHILTQLSNGYLSITEFVKTGANILEALKALPKLLTVDGLNIEEIRNSVRTLFTEENGQKICGYFADKAKLGLLSQNEIAAGTADRMQTATDFSVIENNIAEIKSILLFFDSLADDLILAHGNLLNFCNRIDEAERLDEAHLLPLALETLRRPSLYAKRQIHIGKKERKKRNRNCCKKAEFRQLLQLYPDRLF